MRSHAKLALAALLAITAAVLAPSAIGSPQGDLDSIVRDYSRHDRVTPCRFTQRQLKSARALVSDDVETYTAGITSAIAREGRRWKNGGCKGKGAGASRLRIVAIKATGGPRKESVTIRNTGRRTVDLRGFALRDGTDHIVKLRSSKLKAGRRLTVITGCREGHRKAVQRGTSYYACRKTEIWDDAGDVVELLGVGGGLLAEKTYR